MLTNTILRPKNVGNAHAYLLPHTGKCKGLTTNFEQCLKSLFPGFLCFENALGEIYSQLFVTYSFSHCLLIIFANQWNVMQSLRYPKTANFKCKKQILKLAFLPHLENNSKQYIFFLFIWFSDFPCKSNGGKHYLLKGGTLKACLHMEHSLPLQSLRRHSHLEGLLTYVN